MDATKLGEALWTIHLEHMRVMDEIVERGCLRGESGVLLYLYQVGHPLFSGDLTEKLGLTTGRIANILRVLEKNGMIARTPDAQDKRRVCVALTPAGEAYARQKNADAVAFNQQLLSRLDPSEVQSFLDTLRRIAALLDETIKQ